MARPRAPVVAQYSAAHRRAPADPPEPSTPTTTSCPSDAIESLPSSSPARRTWPANRGPGYRLRRPAGGSSRHPERADGAAGSGLTASDPPTQSVPEMPQKIGFGVPVPALVAPVPDAAAPRVLMSGRAPPTPPLPELDGSGVGVGVAVGLGVTEADGVGELALGSGIVGCGLPVRIGGSPEPVGRGRGGAGARPGGLPGRGGPDLTGPGLPVVPGGAEPVRSTRVPAGSQPAGRTAMTRPDGTAGVRLPLDGHGQPLIPKPGGNRRDRLAAQRRGVDVHQVGARPLAGRPAAGGDEQGNRGPGHRGRHHDRGQRQVPAAMRRPGRTRPGRGALLGAAAGRPQPRSRRPRRPARRRRLPEPAAPVRHAGRRPAGLPPGRWRVGPPDSSRSGP